MAFLDNSGDIILDAVLTDTGRMRLAKGDGSFRVVKFALADDEIDYSLYNGSNSSGSAYYDLEVLQTPILEAFSNNGASMKSKLISISRNNLLYLPQLLVNTVVGGNSEFSKAVDLINNGFILAVDSDTQNLLKSNTYNGLSTGNTGLLYGSSFEGSKVRVDQGINNSFTLSTQRVDSDLLETQYIVEVDNRFASIIASDSVNSSPNTAIPSYIDDDNIASYYFSKGTDVKFVDNINLDVNAVNSSIISGHKGSYLQFKLKSQNDVVQSNYLFEQLGYNLNTALFGSGNPTNVKAILTSISITGVTTGAGITIPLLVVKKINA